MHGSLQGVPYAWPREDLLLTTVTRDSCKTCGFREDRLIPFVPVPPPGSLLPSREPTCTQECQGCSHHKPGTFAEQPWQTVCWPPG